MEFPLILEKKIAHNSAEKKNYNKNVIVTCLKLNFRRIQKAQIPLLISPKIL